MGAAPIRAEGARLVERVPAPPLAADFVRVDAYVRNLEGAVPVDDGWIVSTMGAIARWDRVAARHTWVARFPVRSRGLIALHDDLLYVAVEGAVHAWDATRGEVRSTVIPRACLPTALAVSPDGTRVLFAGSDVPGNPSGFDVPRIEVTATKESGAKGWSWVGRNWDSCQRAGFLPDGSVWIETREQDVLRFTADGERDGVLLHPTSEPWEFDDFDRFVLAWQGGESGPGRFDAIVDRATGARVAVVRGTGAFAVLPEGGTLAWAGEWATHVEVWSPDDVKLATIDLPDPDLDRVTWLGYAPDGRLLVGTLGGDLLVFATD